MVDASVDPNLTLGDLISVINEFQLSDRPVTAQTVVAALVARTNVKHMACPATVMSSRSEPQSAPLIRTTANYTPRPVPVARLSSEPVATHAPVATRAPVTPAPVPSRAPVSTCPTSVPRVPEPSIHIQPNTTTIAKRRKRFYVVVRGRQTGVFDDWQIVKELTDLIPNSYQRSFSTQDQAFEFYNSEKDEGRVQVIWLSKAEEVQYGPKSIALF